jgi:hypothetical protein
MSFRCSFLDPVAGERPDLRLNFLEMPRWQAEARSPIGRLNPRQLAG